MYLFFETKSISTMQGDIGVARSDNQGISWEVLGIALDEEWHLSYPFVFKHDDQVSTLSLKMRARDVHIKNCTFFCSFSTHYFGIRSYKIISWTPLRVDYSRFAVSR